MRQYNKYTLLFNQLWQAKPDIICQIDPNLKIGADWDNMEANINMKTTGEIMQDGIASLLLKLGSKIKEQGENVDKISDKSTSPALFKELPRKGQDLHISGPLHKNWDDLMRNVTNCTKCNLCEGRTYVVTERGSRDAKWMFVGEAPFDVDNVSGVPFGGASGELLDKMIAAMKLDINNDVYICNAIKCMPPSNRNPEPLEVETCREYLLSQIALVKPKIIIALGHFASQALLNTDLAVAKLRGSVKFCNNIPVIVTYPPAYLLRNIEAKKDAWADLQFAMQVFNNTK